eukprot:gene7517-15380_t
MKILYFLLAIFCFDSPFVVASSPRIKPVAVFSPEETDMHKYSAILASTEPYRLQRDSDIKKSMNPIQYWFHKIKGTQFNDPSCLLRLENKAIDLACLRYEKKADEIVRSYGLNVVAFNGLSRKIMENSPLKQRVLLQSYYYRIAADLEDNLRPLGLPVINANLGADGTALSLAGGNLAIDPTKSKLYRFAQALRAIEDERLRQRNNLQNMCDVTNIPLMSKPIQNACADFPKCASQLVTQYGLETEEFNGLKEKMTKDPLFRFRVKREVSKVEKSKRGA